METNTPRPKKFPIKSALLVVVGLLAVFFIDQLFSVSKKDGALPLLGLNSKKAPQFFYYSEDHNLEKTTFKIFKASIDPNAHNEELFSFTFDTPNAYITTDSWQSDKILIVTRKPGESEILELNLTKPGSKPVSLLKIANNTAEFEWINAARYVDKGDALAYITSSGDHAAKNSVLHIYSLKVQKETESHLLNEKSPLYAGFGFLANDEEGIIYLHETGGDGGMVWSTWYKVDRNKKTFEKLEGLPPPSTLSYDTGVPVPAVFSPDGKSMVYTDFSVVFEPSEIEERGELVRCLKYDGRNLLDKYRFEGGVLMLRDMESAVTMEIYRNLAYSDNFCLPQANKIIDLDWLDDETIIFETVDGIYTINKNTKEVKTLLTFEETYDPGNQKRPLVSAIQLPYILFTDGLIANVESGKSVKIIDNSASYMKFFKL